MIMLKLPLGEIAWTHFKHQERLGWKEDQNPFSVKTVHAQSHYNFKCE